MSRDSIAVLAYSDLDGCVQFTFTVRKRRGMQVEAESSQGRVGCPRNLGMYTARQSSVNGVRNDGLIR